MSKYRNKKTIVNGITFDSKKEAARYQTLILAEKAGAISGLCRQVPFELAPAVKIGGRTRPALRYFADFVYSENGETIVEDAKGRITEGYRIKRHLLATVYGIQIRET